MVIVHIPQIQRVLWEQADTPNQNVEVICCLEVHLDLCNNKLQVIKNNNPVITCINKLQVSIKTNVHK